MRYVILGKGGHAQALLDSMFHKDTGGMLGNEDVVCVGKGEDLPEHDFVVIGVGDVETRRRLFLEHEPRVWLRGIQLMRGVNIYPSAKLGDNVLINTGAQVDHDCNIGDHCVISPGAILCGNVTLGEACFIGAGAIIVEGVTLDAGSFVPAGSLCVRQDDLRVPQRVLFPDGARALKYRPDVSHETPASDAIDFRIHSDL